MSLEDWKEVRKTILATLPLGLFLLVQTCGLVWWASAINTRVNRTEQDVGVVCERVRDLEIEAARR